MSDATGSTRRGRRIFLLIAVTVVVVVVGVFFAVFRLGAENKDTHDGEPAGAALRVSVPDRSLSAGSVVL
jgi:flagellar basal body-associated protein FliL